MNAIEDPLRGKYKYIFLFFFSLNNQKGFFSTNFLATHGLLNISFLGFRQMREEMSCMHSHLTNPSGKSLAWNTESIAFPSITAAIPKLQEDEPKTEKCS